MEYVTVSEYCRMNNLVIESFLKKLLDEDEKTSLAFLPTNYGWTPVIYKKQFKKMMKYH